MQTCQTFHWFEPDERQLEWLAWRDQELGGYIAQKGKLRRRLYPDPFWALLRCIVGQQISARAQDTIWGKFFTAFGQLTAGQIASLELEKIRSCGISLRKAAYIQGVASKFASGDLRAASLRAMDDAELAATLTRLPGVGQWTVEMLLIFTFRRANVLSFGDLAIRRGLCLLHGHERITREIFNYYFRLYTPCATIAGFYLWDLAGQKT